MSQLKVIICVGVLISLAACGDDDGNSVCDLSAPQLCECTGLPQGFAICELDGSGWQECECPLAPTNGPPVVVGDLMWQTTLGPSLQPSAAVTYCEEYTESNYDDWRLPTLAEFETFFSECEEQDSGFIHCGGACNDASFCTAASATWYRTSTVASAGKHYIVHTGNGFLMPIDDSFSVSTICVRDSLN